MISIPEKPDRLLRRFLRAAGLRTLQLLVFSAIVASVPSPAFGQSAPASTPDAKSVRDARERGTQFLAQLYDPELSLLPEHRAVRVYWLYHDNYLAAKVLAGSRPDLSRAIEDAIRKHSVTNSGKIEILFDEAPNSLPFRHHKLIEVARIGEKEIRTEILTTNLMHGWEAYADLLLLAAIAEAKSKPARAREHLAAAEQMWDEKGFHDRASEHMKLYATYKLALYLIAARRAGHFSPIMESVSRQLLKMQRDDGGWITDYDYSMRPRGTANVETTCLALLALQTLAAPGK